MEVEALYLNNLLTQATSNTVKTSLNDQNIVKFIKSLLCIEELKKINHLIEEYVQFFNSGTDRMKNSSLVSIWYSGDIHREDSGSES